MPSFRTSDVTHFLHFGCQSSAPFVYEHETCRFDTPTAAHEVIPHDIVCHPEVVTAATVRPTLASAIEPSDDKCTAATMSARATAAPEVKVALPRWPAGQMRSARVSDHRSLLLRLRSLMAARLICTQLAAHGKHGLSTASHQRLPQPARGCRGPQL